MAKILPITPTLLNKFLTCPYQYYAQYVARSIDTTQGPAAKFGEKMHGAIEKTLKEDAPLIPDAVPLFAGPAAALQQFKDNPRYEIFVEKPLAITRSMTVTTWGAADAWIRVKMDVRIHDKELNRNIIIDWKTGKVKEDRMQVLISSLCATVHTKCTENVCAWVFVKYGVILDSIVDLRSMSAMQDLMFNIDKYEEACRTDTFKQKPNGLCKAHCGALDCPHNGKR